MTEILLDVRELAANYGAIKAIRDASLEVRAGEVVAVLGPNGAGKTSLVRSITGLLRPSRGEVRFRDRDISRARPQQIAALGMSVVPEGRRVFPGMSVLDNLLVGAFQHRRDPTTTTATLGRVFELFPRLKERAGQMAGSLSGGEQQMLAVGRALMSRPRLLVLDEPSLGLAPKPIAALYDALRLIHDEGTSILLIEQNLRIAASIAGSCYLMGRGVSSGPHDPSGLEATASGHYLGEDRQSSEPANLR